MDDHTCTSTYAIGGGEALHCTGEHLRGNPFHGDGIKHQAARYGTTWTWTTWEDDSSRAQRAERMFGRQGQA